MKDKKYLCPVPGNQIVERILRYIKIATVKNQSRYCDYT